MISRRRFLRTTASASVAAAAVSTALAVEVASAADIVTADAALATRINAALADFLAEARETYRLSNAYMAISNSLPKRPEPSPGDYWKSRRSALYEDCKVARHADGSVTLPPSRPLKGTARRRVRLATIAGMREAIGKRRAWEAKRRALGLDALNDAIEASAERGDVHRDRLEELAEGFSPAALAVHALFEYRYSRDDDFPLRVLKAAVPHLTGLMRVVVADMIANGRNVNETVFEGGPGGLV